MPRIPIFPVPPISPESVKYISSLFGMQEAGLRAAPHGGLDFAAPVGAPIFAVADAVVTAAAFEEGGAGNYVKLLHAVKGGPKVETLYMHLDKIMVRKGQAVMAGTVIGLCGNTGHSTGPHLHFEVRVEGEKIDPAPLLPAKYVTKAGMSIGQEIGYFAPRIAVSMGLLVGFLYWDSIKQLLGMGRRA